MTDDNLFRHALEEIVLELQKETEKAKIEMQVAQGAEQHYKHLVSYRESRYEAMSMAYYFVLGIYDSTITHQAVNQIGGKDIQDE